jgi:type IV secretory pathway VirD2 relaxase
MTFLSGRAAKGTTMANDHFQPKLGRIRDAKGRANLRTTTRVFRQAGKAGVRAVRLRGHVSPSSLKRGMGTGALAAAGLIAPGSRRVIVKARYTRQRPGDLGAAKAHLRYIKRDGVTRAGLPGCVYDASTDDTDLEAFLDRSHGDPHQFRFIVSPEDSARLPDLKPFIRDLMSHMEQDLGTKLDWVAVDHFNTGHPHSHVVIRGKDDVGEDLIIARDYIGHGVRARAQGLVTLELGPETELERTAKLMNEVEQERLTSLDRRLLARAKDGFVVVTSEDERDPVRQTMRIGRLKKLGQLGLAEERRPGVWSLDVKLEPKLRQLGNRADTFKMMQRALKEAGIERPAPGLALFESGRRRTPLMAKVVAVGLVDEITDRQYVIVDGTDGRVHYAELGRLGPTEVPARGMIVSLSSDSLQGKPKSTPRLQVLSPVDLTSQIAYDGPTWLDRALIAGERVRPAPTGFGAELNQALAGRARWLAEQRLADVGTDGDVNPKPQMLTNLRQRETARLAQSLSRQLNAAHVPHEPGERISGVYDRAIATPTGKFAVIRREDTFTLAPWKPALESLRGRSVSGRVQQNRVTWTLDRGRALPGRGA